MKWDLSDVVPGQYTITAGVDDGCGICGKTKTKEVTVVNTQDCIGPDISCPDLKLLGPDKISGPGVYTVTANISGASSDNEVSYLWTVTNGSIVDGYGTPSIQVRIPRDIKGIDPVVTLQVQGASDPRGMCLDKVSITLPVKPR